MGFDQPDVPHRMVVAGRAVQRLNQGWKSAVHHGLPPCVDSSGAGTPENRYKLYPKLSGSGWRTRPG